MKSTSFHISLCTSFVLNFVPFTLEGIERLPLVFFGTMPDQSEIILKTTLNRKDLSSRCSRQWIDVSFPANAPDNFVLVFQNFYTASITLSQEYPDGPKVLVDNFRLMECAHNENDAQNWHQLSSSDFKQKINLTKPLKILLYQPSSTWAKYELRNIKMVQSDDARSSNATYTEDSESISSCILSDWKLITEASFAQSKLRDLPEISSQSGIDSRRQAKRAAARRKDRRASSAVPMSTMASDTSASVTTSVGAGKY